ncbi:hypothetical protein CRG98_017270 [Punica granatum]|nr:hypothetical protein CRG98_017270 [Punica granatum]
MYRPGGYEDDRYSSRDEYGYGRDREGGYRDDDRSSRNADSYSRDGDHYSKDSEERYGRDGYREDDYQDHQNGSRSRSVDGDRSPDDGQYSAQGLDRKFSDQSISGPPSYEEAVGESRSPEQNGRDQEIPSASVPKLSSPTVSHDASPANAHGPSPPPAKQEVEGFDEFDPRVPVSAAPTNSNAEMDLLGSFSDSFSSNPLAVTPATSTGPKAEAFAANTGLGASDVMQQPFDDPFGDAPFKALPSNGNSNPAQPSADTSTSSFPLSTNQTSDLHQQAASLPDFNFGDSFTALTYASPDSSQFPSQDASNPEEEVDILAGILPPSGPSPVTAAHTPFSAPSAQHLQSSTTAYGDFGTQGGPATISTSQVSPHADMPFNQGNLYHTSGNPASPFSAPSGQSDAGYGDFGSQAGSTTSVTPQMTHQAPIGTDWQSNHGQYQPQTGPLPAQSSGHSYGDFGLQAGAVAPTTSQVSPQLQAGTNMQFNQENFQHQMEPSASPFSAQSQNGQAMRLNNGDLGPHAGPATPVTSQMSPQAPSGMDMPFSHGNLQNQTGPSASPFSSQSQNGQAMQPNNGNFSSLAVPPTTGTLQMPPQAQAGMNMPFNHGNFQNQTGPSVSSTYSASQTNNGQTMQPNTGAPFPQYASTPFTNGSVVLPGGPSAGTFSHNMMPQTPNGSAGQLNNNNFFPQQVSGPPTSQQAVSANRDVLGNMLPQTGLQQSHMNSQQPVSSSAGPLAIVPQQPSKEKFQTKSTVWADTLNRGLVDLNISGPKTNPLADIGVDFDSINRKEKRMEKQPATPVTSTITMGKAMGSGSGMGRAGSIRPPSNPIAGNMGGMAMSGMGGMGMGGGHGPGMGMGMVGGHGSGMGMGGSHGIGSMGMGGMGAGYGGMNQQPIGGMGMGMGMGMNSGYNNMGMGMNPGMGQGAPPMQQPGSGYNHPMMGGSGYPQQHYGGGYR